MSIPEQVDTAGLRLRVVVVGRPYDLSDAQYDGFVARRRPLVAALLERHDVSIALLRPGHDNASVTGALRERVICDHAFAIPIENRYRRLSYTLGLLKRSDAWAPEQQQLLAAVDHVKPDAVVTLGPWFDDVYAPLFRRHLSAHLFEEDLTRMHELAPQSKRARVFRRLDTFVRARRLAQPKIVIVIGEEELAGARRRYPAARSVSLPYVLSPREWPIASSASAGDAVLVVGTLTQERHALGLVEALDALVVQRPLDLRVRLISGAGLHPMLRPYIDLPWVEAPGHVDKLWPEYRAARVVLVPAKRATGIKTTILQGWVTGCPVVTYTASAVTLKPFMHAMLVADDGSGVARQIVKAWNNPILCEDLARRGLDIMENNFDEKRVATAFLQLVSDTAASQ